MMVSILVLVGCGAMIAVQAATDIVLGKSLGLWLFAFMFTVVQLICCLPPLVALGWPVNWALIFKAPLWQYIGGALGVPVLAGMAYALARTGTFSGLVALLVGQLLMGLVIDTLGLFGVATQPLSLSRVGGFLVVILGLWLSKQ